MSKETKAAKTAGDLLGSTTPTGKNPTGKAQAQDIELNPKSTPAGARSPGRNSSFVTAQDIARVLGQGGKVKANVSEADVKEVVFKWLKNESQSLEDLGKTNGGKVLKWLEAYSKKDPAFSELYIDGLKKIKDPNTKEITRQTKQAWDREIGGKQPNESRPKVDGKTVTHRPEKRPNRKYEETTGNMDPKLPPYENLQKIGNRMDGDATTDDDFLYALSQGYSTTKFEGELARIQSMTDPAERAKAINALAINATKGMGRSSDLSTTSKFEQWLDQYLVRIDKPKTSGGGAKVGEGSLPGETQQSLNFDGGGEAKAGGPDISLPEPELKQPNQAANATGTENVPPEPKEPFKAQTVPPAGDVGDSKLEELKNWAINSIRQEVEFRMGGSVDSDPAIQKKYDSLVNEFLEGIDGDPDAIAKLQKLKEGSQPASTEAPQPHPNRQTPNQAASPGNQTRNTTQPVQPGTTPQPGVGGKGSQFQSSGAPKGMSPSGKPQTVPPGKGKGGSTKGWDPVAEAKKFDNDPMRAAEVNLAKEDAALKAKMAKQDAQAPYKYAAAAGVLGSLAWAWLNSGDDEPEGPISPPTASITGGPSTATGSASGSVADGSGGSSGGMSQEQMEYMMKLQQVRDEQKRRFIGTGNGAQGVYR